MSARTRYVDHVQPPAFLANLEDREFFRAKGYESAMAHFGLPRISLAEYAAERNRRGLTTPVFAPHKGRNADVLPMMAERNDGGSARENGDRLRGLFAEVAA